jgi:vitamin K-dependent gamma-carboxylase-like protein
LLTVPDVVPAQRLATFRIAFGAAAGIKSLELAFRTVVYKIPPRPYYSLLPAFPLRVWTILALIMAVSSALIALGFRTRFAGLATGLLSLAFVTGFQYNNHTYLMATLSLLLSFADSGSALSGGRLRGSVSEQAWTWAPPVYLLRAQISIVYIYAALGKLNFDFLSGNVLASLGFNSMIVPNSFRVLPLLATMAVGAVATELFVGVGLWVRRLRPYAKALGVILHASMVLYISENLIVALNLAIFAVMMIAGYTLYFD